MIELDTSQIVVSIIVTIVVGLLSGGLGAYVSIKVFTNELKWINKTVDKHDVELDRLHERFSSHISKHHSSK